MEFFLRFIQTVINIAYLFVYPVLMLVWPCSKNETLPPISNELIMLSLQEVLQLLRLRELTSEELVEAYIQRIKSVNSCVNAVVEDRFDAARKDAKRADELIAKASEEELKKLYDRQPLLGVPFTVKESVGVKSMSFVVGSLKRMGKRSPQDGAAVDLLRKAGAIPLVVSATPEYCFSIETNTHVNGKCLNPYDHKRTPGGSSGGEGALNGAAASIFGIGSDIAGSIRIPSLFNCCFGHKPTGGLVSTAGHFPNSKDPDFSRYLQVGPITRFGRDLELITTIIAGDNAKKLNLSKPLDVKDIKVFYALAFPGVNGFLHHAVSFDIQLSIMKAVKYFEGQGLKTQRAKLGFMKNSTEVAMSAIVRLKDFPLLDDTSPPFKTIVNIFEYLKSIFGKSKYTRDGLVFELMRNTNAFMPQGNLIKYRKEAEMMRKAMISLLGDDGVLFFPTFHVPAIHHHSSHMPLWGIDYCLVFNALGLPATHVPMGLDEIGLPVGFQVIAAPFKDKLCFQIATELEEAVGGWVPPTFI